MVCSQCGTENTPTSKFCVKCGAKLEVPAPIAAATASAPATTHSAPVMTSQPVQTPSYPRPSAVANPASSAATTGGLAGLIGGVVIVIGWFTPWLGVGSGYGGLFGLGAVGGFNIGTGSGLQLFIAMLAGLAASSGSRSAGAVGVLLIALALAIVLLIIPLFGLLCIRTGYKTFEERASSGKLDALIVKGELRRLQSRAIWVLALMTVIYILISLIPFFTALLGNGFFITIGGALIILVGVLFAKSQMTA